MRRDRWIALLCLVAAWLQVSWWVSCSSGPVSLQAAAQRAEGAGRAAGRAVLPLHSLWQAPELPLGNREIDKTLTVTWHYRPSLFIQSFYRSKDCRDMTPANFQEADRTLNCCNLLKALQQTVAPVRITVIILIQKSLWAGGHQAAIWLVMIPLTALLIYC